MFAYQQVQSKQIFLNTKHANYKNGSKKSDVDFPLTDVLTVDANTIEIKFSLVNAQIPYSFYQINATNNKIIINLGTGTTSYYLSHGNYTINSFIAMFKSICGSSWIVTFSTTTNKLTFTNSSAFSFWDDTTSIFPLLGFIKGDQYFSVGNSLTPPNCINLNPLRKLHVASNSFSLKNIDSFNKSITNIIASIPVSSAPGGVILYENYTNFRSQFHNSTQMSPLTINIYDEDENDLDFNGVDWSITLQLDIVQEITISKEDLQNLYEDL